MSYKKQGGDTEEPVPESVEAVNRVGKTVRGGRRVQKRGLTVGMKAFQSRGRTKRARRNWKGEERMEARINRQESELLMHAGDSGSRTRGQCQSRNGWERGASRVTERCRVAQVSQSRRTGT